MLNIIKFKGCKRCGGDLFLEHDSEGDYVFCLQCSAVYTRQLTIPPPPMKKYKTRKVYAH
jgi:DNA-directed RNA polymerase subunit RPC12/RpoP